jgi:hypothetical protein
VGSALRLAEEAVEFAAGRIQGALFLFRAVVDQWAAVGMNRIAKKSLRSNFSQRRGVVQVANDFSSEHPEVVHVLVFGERLDEAKCSMNGRRQATSSSPGGRSFSSPIHERGQLSRSRQ